MMDEQRSRRPTSITSQKVQEIKELLDKDRRIMVREVSPRVYCSVGTVHTIINDNLNISNAQDGSLKCCQSVRKLKGWSHAGVLFSNSNKKGKIISVGL